ncbi:MAG: hypothetical protein ACYCXW_00750 [Solirubrobacteraceae bacterium]
MQNNPTVVEDEDVTDCAVVGLLVNCDQRLWSREELEREFDRNLSDSLHRLYGAGLIHRLQGFVWATRAAIKSDEIGS